MACKDCGEPARGQRCAACEYKWLYVLDPKRLAYARERMAENLNRPARPSNAVDRREEPRATWVYFVRCGDRIRIGYSGDPDRMVRNLKTEEGITTDLVLTIPGGRETADTIQHRFRHLSIDGSWFMAGPALLAFLQAEAGSPLVLDPSKALTKKDRSGS